MKLFVCITFLQLPETDNRPDENVISRIRSQTSAGRSLSLSLSPKRTTKIHKLKSGLESDRRKTQTNTPNKFGWTKSNVFSLQREGLATRLEPGIIGRLTTSKPNELVPQKKQTNRETNLKGDHCPTRYDTPAKLLWYLQNSLPHLSIWRHSSDTLLLLTAHPPTAPLHRSSY